MQFNSDHRIGHKFSCFKTAPLWRHWPGGGQEEARRGPGRGNAPSLSCILTTEGSFLYHPRNHAVYIIMTSVVSGRHSTKQSALTGYVHEDFSIFRHCQLPKYRNPLLHSLTGSCQPAQKCLTVYRATCNNQTPGDLYTTQQNSFCLLGRFGCFGLVGLGVLFCFDPLRCRRVLEGPHPLSY